MILINEDKKFCLKKFLDFLGSEIKEQLKQQLYGGEQIHSNKQHLSQKSESDKNLNQKLVQ